MLTQNHTSSVKPIHLVHKSILTGAETTGNYIVQKLALMNLLF